MTDQSRHLPVKFHRFRDPRHPHPPMSDPTQALIAAQDGDPAAFDRFVRLTIDDVTPYCRYLGDRDHLDDLVQDTYLRALRSLHTYRGDSDALRWLLAIARRACADAIDHHQRGGEPNSLAGRPRPHSRRRARTPPRRPPRRPTPRVRAHPTPRLPLRRSRRRSATARRHHPLTRRSGPHPTRHHPHPRCRHRVTVRFRPGTARPDLTGATSRPAPASAVDDVAGQARMRLYRSGTTTNDDRGQEVQS